MFDGAYTRTFGGTSGETIERAFEGALDGGEVAPAAAGARRPGGGRSPVAGSRLAHRGAIRTGSAPRRAAGPRPARPVAPAGPVRPAEGERPARPEPSVRACPARQRVLPRPAGAVPVSTAGWPARFAAGLLAVLLAAAVVVGLGQLSALAGGGSGGGSEAGYGAGAPVAVTEQRVVVGAERTVWDVAARLEPGADGARQAALAEQLVVDNALRSVEVRPGQVLRIPHG